MNSSKINDVEFDNIQDFSCLPIVDKKHSLKLNHIKNIAIAALIFTILWIIFIIIGMIAVFVPGFTAKTQTGWILIGVGFSIFIIVNVLMIIIKFGFFRNNKTNMNYLGRFEFLLNICGLVLMCSAIPEFIDFFYEFITEETEGFWYKVFSIIMGIALVLAATAITFSISVITLSIGSIIINSKIIYEENKILFS